MRCDDCGFTYDEAEAAGAAAAIRRLARTAADQLTGVAAATAGTRPDDTTWSALEYSCHVRDVLLVVRERLLLARREVDPTPAMMGRDERVEHDGYAEQDPTAVARQLVDAADLFANDLDRLDADAWDRTLVFALPTPAPRSLRWLAVHTVHEVSHHLEDLRRSLAATSSTSSEPAAFTDLVLPPYPGRGIVTLTAPDGGRWWLYFLTGRSEASRARHLVFEWGRLRVKATEDGGPPDPLRHYTCARQLDHRMIVGNGAHVDDLERGLVDGFAVDRIVDLLMPEPDPPLNTARIAVVTGEQSDVLFAVRSRDGQIERQIQTVPTVAGTGWLLHTYGGAVDAVTTDAVVRAVSGIGDPLAFARKVWAALDPLLRVAVAVGRVPDPRPLLVLS